MGEPAARPDEGRAAAVGTLFIALLFAVGALAWPRAHAVSDRVIRVEGEVARPGWYEAPSVAAAVDAAGGSAPGLATAEVPDGATVRVVGEWALVAADPAAAVTTALAARGGRVHVNSASQAELEALPRVGPTLAARIIAGRPYRTVAELDRVRGIGPATLRAIGPLVSP